MKIYIVECFSLLITFYPIANILMRRYLKERNKQLIHPFYYTIIIRIHFLKIPSDRVSIHIIIRIDF